MSTSSAASIVGIDPGSILHMATALPAGTAVDELVLAAAFSDNPAASLRGLPLETWVSADVVHRLLALGDDAPVWLPELLVGLKDPVARFAIRKFERTNTHTGWLRMIYDPVGYVDDVYLPGSGSSVYAALDEDRKLAQILPTLIIRAHRDSKMDAMRELLDKVSSGSDLFEGSSLADLWAYGLAPFPTGILTNYLELDWQENSAPTTHRGSVATGRKPSGLFPIDTSTRSSADIAHFLEVTTLSVNAWALGGTGYENPWLRDVLMSETSLGWKAVAGTGRKKLVSGRILGEELYKRVGEEPGIWSLAVDTAGTCEGTLPEWMATLTALQ